MTSTEARVAYGNPIRVILDDGTEFVVHVTNPDRLRWDMEAPRRKWGKATDSPILSQTFITWSAAKREAATDLTWDQFQTRCVVLEDAAEDEDIVIRPTTTAPGPGPS
jgi:hypothetical protein